MKSKLQNTIAQLFKIKNQMRLQLDQIRPHRQPIIIQKKQVPGKKIFIHKHYNQTDIILPIQQKQIKRGKKICNTSFSTSMHRCQDIHKIAERKHFYREYNNSVSLDNSVKKRTSSYFNIKNHHFQSINTSTSLYGIGRGDKSHSPLSARVGIKVYPQKLKRQSIF